ncbi:SDR family oxidoreductase [Actinophytocola sp.]|uniref:SDR family oxidoreductase n=1 Tax=Actinophytocola sp. TaxID=1872138 RepID=UPI002ED49B33
MSRASAGILGSEYKSPYGAAKSGLIGFTRVLAIEGAEHNIMVNAIAPVAATRMLAVNMAQAEEERQLDPAALAMMHAVASKLDPALVSPVVAFLAHEDCPVTGEIYTAGAGQVARFFTARTKGYHHPALSIEDIRDHLAEIRDETGYTTPGHSGEEIAQLLQAIAVADTR